MTDNRLIKEPATHRACGRRPRVVDGDGYFRVECSRFECQQHGIGTDLYAEKAVAIERWDSIFGGKKP